MVDKKDSIPEFLLDNPAGKPKEQSNTSKLTVLVKDALGTEVSKEGSLSEREVGLLEKGFHEVKKVFSSEPYSKEIQNSSILEENEKEPNKGFIGKTLELFGVGVSNKDENK